MPTNIRNMPTNVALALFGKARREILSTLLLNPERSWYMGQLAEHLGVGSSSLERELARLVGAGVITRSESGNRTYFRADTSCPVFEELRGFFVKTTGLADQVRDALESSGGKIKLAFIYGSVARHSERTSSDVDLFVLGDVNLADLAERLRPLEPILGRAVNPSLYSVTEFRDKLNSGHHFINSVMREPKIFLIGSECELAEVTERRKGEASHNEQG